MRFDWDEANEQHLARHGITPEEAEEALTDPRRIGAPAYDVEGERRRAFLGSTTYGRVLFVVTTIRRREPAGHNRPRRDLGTAAAVPEVVYLVKRRKEVGGLTVATTPTSHRVKTIERWEDVPQFSSEDEEAAFWATHDTGQGLLDQMRPIALDGEGELPPARATTTVARTRPISVRLDDDVLRRLKTLAKRKNKGYQSLLKEFLLERLYEEEKREGIIV